MKTFEQHTHHTVAPQSQTPDDIFLPARVVFDDARGARFYDLNGSLGHVPLQTPGADSADHLAALRHQHSRARTPVGRAFDADDGRQRHSLTATTRALVSIHERL